MVFTSFHQLLMDLFSSLSQICALLSINSESRLHLFQLSKEYIWVFCLLVHLWTTLCQKEVLDPGTDDL